MSAETNRLRVVREVTVVSVPARLFPMPIERVLFVYDAKSGKMVLRPGLTVIVDAELHRKMFEKQMADKQ